MFDRPVVYVDIETSGSNYTRSSIIEIAAIRVEQGRITEEYRSLINPGTSLPTWITNLTGITDDDLVQAPYFDDIAYQLHKILDGAIFVAHNVQFDHSYVKRQLEQAGYTFRPPLLCTVRLSRALYPQHRSHSLESLIHRHQLGFANRHRAYDDAAAIKQFAELAYQEHGAEQFAAAVAQQLKTQSLPANLAPTKMDELKNEPGVYVFKDDAGRPLYVGKSVAIRSRVLSHFSDAKHNTKELRMAMTTHDIETIPATNELEALLLESEMVKNLAPIHNRKLRRVTSYYIVEKQLDEQGYATLTFESRPLQPTDDFNQIMGLYTSKAKLKNALITKLKTFELCPKLMGLENYKGACFLYQLHKCHGACIGKESPEQYNERFDLAMSHSKLETWPFQSAIAVDTGKGDSVVLNNWVVTGYLNIADGKRRFRKIEPIFSLDSYRILRSYFKQHRGSLVITPFTG